MFYFFVIFQPPSSCHITYNTEQASFLFFGKSLYSSQSGLVYRISSFLPSMSWNTLETSFNVKLFVSITFSGTSSSFSSQLLSSFVLTKELLLSQKGPAASFSHQAGRKNCPACKEAAKAEHWGCQAGPAPMPSGHRSHITPQIAGPLRRGKKIGKQLGFYAREFEHYLKELFKILDRTLNWIGHCFFRPRVFILFF